MPIWKIGARHKEKKGQILFGNFKGETRAEVTDRFKAEFPEYKVVTVRKIRDT